ncbi:hypothetical protein ACTA71_007155, partial [Dictyostelium dimigraforme]
KYIFTKQCIWLCNFRTNGFIRTSF